jgi:DNA-binding response OmpR family regulator
MRILIAEDEWLIAATIERILLDGKFEIAGKTSSMTAALKLIDEVEFDAAILDANLAGVSAEPVAMALTLRRKPFLIISGYADGQRTGLLATAPFVGKPFTPQLLMAAIRSLLA